MTYQIGDKLRYKGEVISIGQEILEEYFAKNSKKRPAQEWLSTDLYRGYIAEMEVRDQELLLVDIKVESRNRFVSVIKDIFPTEEQRFMDWYSGLILVDDEPSDFWIRVGRQEKREFYRILEITEGKITDERQYTFEDYPRFKHEQFEYFKLSEDYPAEYERWRNNNPGISDERIDECIASVVLHRSKKFLAD